MRQESNDTLYRAIIDYTMPDGTKQRMNIGPYATIPTIKGQISREKGSWPFKGGWAWLKDGSRDKVPGAKINRVRIQSITGWATVGELAEYVDEPLTTAP